MTVDLNSCIVRYIIRKTRHEKGWRQEDVKGISHGTVSNIERGTNYVDPETVRGYLRQLGLTENRLKSLVQKEEKQVEALNFQLEAIDSMLDNDKTGKARQLLKDIEIESYHPLSPYHTYLQGRCYQAKRDWTKAEKHYRLAIRLRKQYNLNLKGNIVSICYNRLSICFHLQNKMDKALDYVEKGLDAYNNNEGEQNIWYALNSNKVWYLLNSYQFDSAKQVLSELWASMPQIRNMKIVLNLHRYKAIILKKLKQYPEALQVCKEGVDLARRNGIQNRYLDLMNILGSIYLMQNQLHQAKQLFQTVLDYDYEVAFPRSRIDALIYLATTQVFFHEWTKAEDIIQDALKLAQNVPYFLPKVLLVAGNIYAAQNKWSEAVTFYQKAEEIAEKGRDKKRQYSALLQLSNCFDMMGLEAEWKSCTKKLLKLQHEIYVKDEEDISMIWFNLRSQMGDDSSEDG
ncbi:tetratricopeptide repeat protein [Lihuaxuella thermophila]|uniref:Tetratricopeptide repeat-containing protein n=1 Tax=Lihuaxuella thermophila TaxID=1173111 RepID=A0A1H8CRR8_9BACL|nr:tetratricopeptide repeat protein [Lihuaxuella thermophila]SEM97921.1 Tetratricopeptide repeat-containing protein [Lihuaxuella thermophila]